MTSSLQMIPIVPATGTVYYEDNGVNYQSEFDIDTEHYATIFSFESDEEKLLKEMKNQTAELKRMKESIRASAGPSTRKTAAMDRQSIQESKTQPAFISKLWTAMTG